MEEHGELGQRAQGSNSCLKAPSVHEWQTETVATAVRTRVRHLGQPQLQGLQRGSPLLAPHRKHAGLPGQPQRPGHPHGALVLSTRWPLPACSTLAVMLLKITEPGFLLLLKRHMPPVWLPPCQDALPPSPLVIVGSYLAHHQGEALSSPLSTQITVRTVEQPSD